MNYQEFKNKYNGKHWNYDGYYGYQCWDLVAFYLQEVLKVPVYLISDYQNTVKNANSDFFKYFDEVDINKMVQGDICIWTDSLHICLYDHWDGVTYFLSQDANARPTGVYSQVTSGHTFRAFRKKQPKPLFTIEKVPTKKVKYKKDVSLWDLSFTSFSNAVAVNHYKKDEVLEVGAIAIHVVGSKYYISKYDYEHKINNGINIDDCYDYVEPVVVETPIVEQPIVTEPNKPTENDDIKPIEEPKQEDNTNNTEIIKESRNGFKSIIKYIIEKILEYLKERYNNDKKNFKSN